MKRVMAGKFFSACALGLAAGAAAAGIGSERWFYCGRGHASERDFAATSNLVLRAAAAGFNGILYAGGLDTYAKWGADQQARFQRLRGLSEAHGVEVVPLVWSPGYGTLNSYRSDLVETVRRHDVPHVARNGRIVFESTETLSYQNAGFEEFDAKRKTFPHWSTETPGVCSFQDLDVKHSGRASVRLEPNRDGKHQARVMQTIKVKPFHNYRFSMWIKYRDIPKVFGALRIEVYSGKKAPCGYTGVLVRRTVDGNSDWQKVSCAIPADETGVIKAFMGTWNLKSGTFWLDDIEIEEIGYRELGGRPAPFVVRNAETGKAYRAGVDYLPPKPGRVGSNIYPSKGERDLSFAIPKGRSITEGTRLLVDAYVPSQNGGKQQRSTCMSDPLVYEAMRESAKGIMAACAPKHWFLSTDEVRNFNSCPTCEARHTDGAHLIGEFITKAMATIRAVRADAEVCGWADMFLPSQNGKEQFADAWKYVPQDFIMCDWSGGASDASVNFFAGHGFAVIGSICLDGSASAAPRVPAWADRLRKIEKPHGLIFTTWVNDYRLLEEFAKLAH